MREKERRPQHLSVHQWIRSAIPDSQQPISPIGFLFLKHPPPLCAVLLVYCTNSSYKYVVSDRSAHFFDKSRLSRPPEAPIFRKICHFRKFLNRQISVKIRAFVRNFRKIWDFWHNYMMYWINSGYKCRVSDRGAHFLDRRPVLCNNII